MNEPSRILIVDDSGLARRMSREAINNLLPAAVIVEAKDGADALEKVNGDQFDVAFIDLNMPGMDGITLARELSRRDDRTRLVLCTANIQETTRQRADELGMKFIAKPISSDKVKAFLDSLD